ncbi:MAG: Helix-turn-helix motif, partial [uncultured Thiotrichaceae bacterium]
MDIYPVKTEVDYQRALTDIEGLMDAEFGTEDGDRLDILVTLVEEYERRHYPIDFPSPIEAIKFAMEQRGLTVADLVPMIGAKNRVYEVLNGKRSLSLAMIKKLHAGLNI